MSEAEILTMSKPRIKRLTFPEAMGVAVEKLNTEGCISHMELALTAGVGQKMAKEVIQTLIGLGEIVEHHHEEDVWILS